MKITVDYTAAQGYHLVADSYGFRAIAGTRLFKAPPHPDIQFSGHEFLDQAQKEAIRLQNYLDQLPKKKISKAKLRKQGAD